MRGQHSGTIRIVTRWSRGNRAPPLERLHLASRTSLIRFVLPAGAPDQKAFLVLIFFHSVDYCTAQRLDSVEVENSFRTFLLSRAGWTWKALSLRLSAIKSPEESHTGLDHRQQINNRENGTKQDHCLGRRTINYPIKLITN